jgi:hypothetical protein
VRQAHGRYSETGQRRCSSGDYAKAVEHQAESSGQKDRNDGSVADESSGRVEPATADTEPVAVPDIAEALEEGEEVSHGTVAAAALVSEMTLPIDFAVGEAGPMWSHSSAAMDP